jgi:hypothetical protein
MNIPYYRRVHTVHPLRVNAHYVKEQTLQHILWGNVPHTKHSRHIIQRHDATGRCILKHIRKGARHGGFFILADVGSMDKLASYGITHMRIPQWMMPAGADITV